MRTRLLQGTDFHVSETYITIENHAIDTPSVRLLYDETADVLIASTGVKNNITCSGSVITLVPFDLLNDEGQVIGLYSEFNPTHAYTLAVDYGKIDYAQEETLRGLIEELPKMLFNSHSGANAMNAVVNNVSRKYIVVGETVLQMEGYEIEAYKLAPIDRNSLDSEYVYVERGDFDEGGDVYKLSNMQSVLVGTVESVFSINLNTKEHADTIKQAILTAIANIPQPDLSAVAKEQTLQDTAKEVHEIAVGTDFTFVKNAIISGGARYDYDGLYGYSPRRGMSVSFYRWRNTLQGYVCTLLDDTKVDGVIYGWTNELVPPEAGSHGKPTDPTGGTIESFEYDNLETEKMATANKEEILQAIPADYAKEDNATNNKLELLSKLNQLINMIGPGDSFANFVAAPNLIYLGTASYDEDADTIYIGEDGYYDENEQTIFING